MFVLLSAEKFSETLLYLGIAFFQLVGIRRQKFQILELGLVRRIGDLGMAGIKTFFIRQQLLRLLGKNKFGEQLRGIGMRRVLGNGHRRYYQRNAFFGIDDLDRIALF